MARKTGRTGGRKSGEGDGGGEQPRTVEQLNDEQLQALTYQHMNLYSQALAKKKAADADFKNVCKKAKAEIGEDAIDEIKDLIAADTEEGEAKLKRRVERTLRIARWAGASFGTQFEVFDGVDRTPAVDRARAEGKRAGLKGEPRKPPHDPSTPQYAAWIEGYDEGQTLAQDALRTQMERSNAEKAGAGEGPSFAQTMREQNDRENKKIGEAAKDIGTKKPTLEVVN